ncbi:ZRC1 [Candida oxycetoniae]|uniref:ZRC1 n=1 Tax=Candida oxycetoniae TaxID=497107 RepID=A0AAI9SX59_9ASCO|nr:ZRC1 [Candida oxycetoniae]KAI3404399.2 ZRC1 [Candida oxycetoniae]
MNNKEIRISALLVLDTVFFLLEVIIGYTVQSLALIADSFHMLNDIISLIIALWAVRMKNSKPADGKYTYGWQRAEILGALINAVFLIALCFTIIIDAISRFFQPQVITNPKLILVVGIAGLLSNGVGLVLFHEHGHSHSHGGGGHSHHGASDIDSTSHSQAHSHSHSHATSPHGDDEESSLGFGETTPLISSVNRTFKSTPSQVFDYFPDNVVERYVSATVDNDNDVASVDIKSSNHSSNQHDHLDDSEHAEELKAKKTKRKSMNMEGVFLHVLGDALGNVGVIITALIIWKTDYSWRFHADPLTSLIITFIIFNSALPLCRKSSKILLQATPPYINSDQIVKKILKLKLVENVHDFHVWNLNEDILIASLHIELAPSCEVSLPALAITTTTDSETHNQSGTSKTHDNINETEGANTLQINRKLFLTVVSQVRDVLHKYGIHSVTIQPEFPSTKLQKTDNNKGLASSSNNSNNSSSNNNGNNNNNSNNNNNNNNNNSNSNNSNTNNGYNKNVFGSTSRQTCLIDDLTNCDSQSCH